MPRREGLDAVRIDEFNVHVKSQAIWALMKPGLLKHQHTLKCDFNK